MNQLLNVTVSQCRRIGSVGDKHLTGIELGGGGDLALGGVFDRLFSLIL